MCKELGQEVHLIPKERQQGESPGIDIGSRHHAQIVVVVPEGSEHLCPSHATQVIGTLLRVPRSGARA